MDHGSRGDDKTWWSRLQLWLGLLLDLLLLESETLTEEGPQMFTYCATYKKHFILPEKEVILSITVTERC